MKWTNEELKKFIEDNNKWMYMENNEENKQNFEEYYTQFEKETLIRFLYFTKTLWHKDREEKYYWMRIWNKIEEICNITFENYEDIPEKINKLLDKSGDKTKLKKENEELKKENEYLKNLIYIKK